MASSFEWGGQVRTVRPIAGPAMPKRGRLTAHEAYEYVRVRCDPKLLDAHRINLEREWIKNLAFLNGNQHWIEVGSGFRPPVLAPHRVLYRANFIRTLVTKMVATVMANSVTFRAPAVNWTKAARDQAFVSEKLFEHIRDNVLDWPSILEDALQWAAVCGTGFIEVGWDSEAGSPDRFYLDEQGRPLVGLDGDQKRMLESLGHYEDIPQGEVFGRSRSPFQAQWDWSARKDFDEAQWGATKELVDIESLENVFGYAKVKEVRPLEPKSHALWYDEMLKFMAGMSGLGMTPGYITPQDKKRERAVLVRYWERPSRRNNFDGRFIAIANDVTLANGRNPLTATKYPIPLIKIDWQRRPGSFIGHGPVEDMRNAQFQYNNARAKQTEVLNVHSHPPIIVDKKSGLPTGHMAIEPGVVYSGDVVGTAGKPIALGPVPQIPRELGESVQLALSEMHMMASQADPDMSKLPGQIRGGPALSMMIEEKNKALLPPARSALRATLSMGRMCLSIAKHNYSSRRVLKYVGEDNAYRILAFDAADIIDDLRITGEPEYFKTKASERAQLLELAQAGIIDPINNPDDKITAMKIFAFGNAEEAIAERLADEDNQEREWDEMTSNPQRYLSSNRDGQPMLNYPTQPFDDDAAHMRVMRRRFKSAEFRENPDPFAKQLLLQHYGEHEAKLQRAMILQQIQMQAMQGSARGSPPAERGSPSKPKQTQGAATSG